MLGHACRARTWIRAVLAAVLQKLMAAGQLLDGVAGA